MVRMEGAVPQESPIPGHQMGGSYPQQSFPQQSFPTVQPPQPQIGRPWGSGLFDCDKDPTNAVMTAICPCVTFGQIAEVMDGVDPLQGSQLSCTFGTLTYLLMMPVCAHCFIASKYRARMRNKFNLVEAPYEDAISHLFCPVCSLCQEFRELKNRNLDPALGWRGIVAQQQEMMQYGGNVTNPPPPQSMAM